jgi:hypothetical protein
MTSSGGIPGGIPRRSISGGAYLLDIAGWRERWPDDQGGALTGVTGCG